MKVWLKYRIFQNVFPLLYKKSNKKQKRNRLLFHFFNEAENVTCLIPKNFFYSNMKKVVLYFWQRNVWVGEWMRGPKRKKFTWNSMQILLPHRHNLTSDYRAHIWLQYNGEPWTSLGLFWYLLKRRCCNWVGCHQNCSIMWRKLSRSSFIYERQQTQIMAGSGDTEMFGSWHKLAANKSFFSNFQLCVPP